MSLYCDYDCKTTQNPWYVKNKSLWNWLLFLQKHDIQHISTKTLPENLDRPRKQKSPFSVFYTAKNKKNAGHQPESPPSRAPKPLPSGMGTAKVTLFSINHVRFQYFRLHSLWKTAQRSQKQARTALLQQKNNKSIVFRHKKPSASPKQATGKNDSRKWGRTIYLESVPEGTPSLPFFKNWCRINWKSIIYKICKNIHFCSKWIKRINIWFSMI